MLEFALLVVVAIAPQTEALAQSPELVKYRVTPQSTDSAIHRYNAPHYIVFERGTTSKAPLLVFMPGTGGQPARASDFADVAAHQGYRVIGLEYMDEPAVQQICPRNRDPKCAEKFRQKRIFGDDVIDVIDDRPAESVVNRLTKLLLKLQLDHPGEGWSDYLDGDKLKWNRIAVSGLSQGAGMAAYIAQKLTVARVVLFSSPWDNYGPQHTFAPWVLAGHGTTPPERWFGSYHQKEQTADLIARAYAALGVPSSQVRVFTMEPARSAGPNPYHASGVANGSTPRNADGKPAYLEEWRFLLGDVH